MAFELCDSKSANLIGRYETEARALAVVLSWLEQYGRDAVQAWELIRDVPEGELETVSAGEALARRALASVPV